jgi:hypothetical protein
MRGRTSSFNRISAGIQEKTLPAQLAGIAMLSGSFIPARALPDDRPALSGGDGAVSGNFQLAIPSPGGRLGSGYVWCRTSVVYSRIDTGP